MNISNLCRIVDGIENDTLVKIQYLVEADTTKEYKLTHSEPIMKRVEMEAKIGCVYENLPAVKEADAKREAEGIVKKVRKNNFSPLIENKVYYNSNTKKYYLYVYPTQNCSYKAEYNKEVKAEDLKHHSGQRIIQKITTDKIISIAS